MTIKTILTCLAIALLAWDTAAEEPEPRGRERSLEQPPPFTGGAAASADKKAPVARDEQSPPVADDGETDEELEPTVTIKQQRDVTVYEYRLNGLLYGIKVVPRNAPPYYLVDTDGDGFLDWPRNGLTSPNVNRIPAWVFFRW